MQSSLFDRKHYEPKQPDPAIVGGVRLTDLPPLRQMQIRELLEEEFVKRCRQRREEAIRTGNWHPEPSVN